MGAVLFFLGWWSGLHRAHVDPALGPNLRILYAGVVYPAHHSLGIGKSASTLVRMHRLRSMKTRSSPPV